MIPYGRQSVDDDDIAAVTAVLKGDWLTQGPAVDEFEALTCVPFPGDDVRRYDGYHSEPDLGLEPGFLATRPGCDAPRDPTGCENVWSSAAWDPGRRLMYFASSNCDLDDDRSSLFGAAVMPPYDEAVVAMAPDGTPVWRWRPRDVDNADLAFGAVPNLFTIDVDGARVDVVGIGNKDGTYTVLDRDGRNERSGVNWDDPEAATQLPYWRTRVTEGGSIGGILATAAVDADARRIVFSTAPGFDPLAPQRPTVHALDMDTGAVAWDNAVYDGLGGDSSYGPTSAVAGVAFVGSTITSTLRAYDTTTGELLYVRPIGDRFLGGVASGAAVVDGIVVVGTGLGAMNGDHPYSDAELMARTPQSLVALCVTGVPGCPVVSPGAPSGVVAAASDAEPGAAAVTWVPPRDDGGSALVAQTVTATPGGAQVTVGGGTGSATVRGLEPGTSYVFTVTARNEIGAGITSAPSAATPVRVADPTSWCDGRAATIMGTAGPNLLHGTAGDDVIVAGGGSDTVLAGSGDDVVCGGDGYDILAGGDGVDVLAGGDGGDWLFGGAGDDVVNSGDGTDVVRGDTGDDSVDGGAGHDFVAGGAGDDMVNGRSGNDVLACDSGEDQVDGGPGFDPASGCELSWNLP